MGVRGTGAARRASAPARTRHGTGQASRPAQRGGATPPAAPPPPPPGVCARAGESARAPARPRTFLATPPSALSAAPAFFLSSFLEPMAAPLRAGGAPSPSPSCCCGRPAGGERWRRAAAVWCGAVRAVCGPRRVRQPPRQPPIRPGPDRRRSAPDREPEPIRPGSRAGADPGLPGSTTTGWVGDLVPKKHRVGNPVPKAPGGIPGSKAKNPKEPAKRRKSKTNQPNKHNEKNPDRRRSAPDREPEPIPGHLVPKSTQ